MMGCVLCYPPRLNQAAFWRQEGLQPYFPCAVHCSHSVEGPEIGEDSTDMWSVETGNSKQAYNKGSSPWCLMVCRDQVGLAVAGLNWSGVRVKTAKVSGSWPVVIAWDASAQDLCWPH